MSSETAADTLVLADMHADKEMKSHALGFLSGSEAAKVTKSAGWKKMFRTHPYLVDETIEALTARKTVG
ncbi:TD and POZ domain-containing protein 2-like [Culex quinquefasciatus]|uniref:TD and POZ domain-containing protein 2-like n=1 Tax=Culex quinquefasciatus TaxID=7176 RepID=UPI0018E3E0E1|nr:TD and POZ domain-containing protein 2-like [Culex quinquefasciatus]